MLDRILAVIKKFIPQSLFKALQPAYHFALGYIAALLCGWPSEKMIVVGVTGTTGKTTTIYLLASILKAVGLKAGYLSTAFISDGEKEILNDKKMTMLGRFQAQKMLRRMVKNKCTVAIIETTSQGIEQFRHRFINYDILLFTGLYPEHIEAHGGFENYKKAKGQLFEHLQNCKKKNINGKEIPKTIIVNADDEHTGYFLDFWAEKKITFSIKEAGLIAEVKMKILGEFNVQNALAAATAAATLGVSPEKIKKGLESAESVPGRMEKIDAGQKFMVMVDYAYEPNAVTKLYETVKNIPHNKTIHVLGSAGGGRDKTRRPKLGKLASQNADYIIVTNEDPYGENPVDIINQVFSGVVGFEVDNDFTKSQIPNPKSQTNSNYQNSKSKTEGINCWRILDRREAIKKALTLAGDQDIVLVTGKGSEQAICVADGKKIPWDDRKVIRELLR